MIIAMFLDPQGMPRAWGKSHSEEDATACAMIELDAYRDKKRALGDPLGDAEYTLSITSAECGCEDCTKP